MSLNYGNTCYSTDLTPRTNKQLPNPGPCCKHHYDCEYEFYSLCEHQTEHNQVNVVKEGGDNYTETLKIDVINAVCCVKFKIQVYIRKRGRRLHWILVPLNSFVKVFSKTAYCFK